MRDQSYDWMKNLTMDELILGFEMAVRFGSLTIPESLSNFDILLLLNVEADDMLLIQILKRIRQNISALNSHNLIDLYYSLTTVSHIIGDFNSQYPDQKIDTSIETKLEAEFSLICNEFVKYLINNPSEEKLPLKTLEMMYVKNSIVSALK